MTSIFRIQSVVTSASSKINRLRNIHHCRGIYQTNGVSNTLPRASRLGSDTLLTILDLESLELQIVAASTNQDNLAETRILRLFGYIHVSFMFRLLI
ncbi:hypothetical protein THOB06_10524 [Vibrio rotiferianus]|nr:hypothetical protein THOG10_10520 [Vibrio rotiferianus]CAH1558465.1 hypothetical protein THOB06_10524 [Vibrio rotiferianus]